MGGVIITMWDGVKQVLRTWKITRPTFIIKNEIRYHKTKYKIIIMEEKDLKQIKEELEAQMKQAEGKVESLKEMIKIFGG